MSFRLDRVGCMLAVVLVALTVADGAWADGWPERGALSWRWRRHHVLDYVATGGMTATAIGFEVAPSDGAAERVGGILFDDAVRDAFVLGKWEDRSIASRASDVLVISLLIHRVVVDDVLVTWLGHGAGDTALQMASIDLQGIALALMMTAVAKRSSERERPSATLCRTDSTYDRRCEEQSAIGSFPSGHSALAFTAAALSCSHHARLRLYGSRWSAVSCVSAAVGAAGVAFGRVLADRHYATDVLMGATIGVVSGGLLPWLSFYAHEDEATTSRVTLTPTPIAEGAALTLRGDW